VEAEEDDTIASNFFLALFVVSVVHGGRVSCESFAFV
jgi:hypothetical protein